MIYLDSSAIVKLARREAETDTLRSWLIANPGTVFASAVARTECTRALMRTQPAAIRVLRSVLTTIHQAPVTDAILDSAATMPGVALRSLDAIHLATAEEFRHVLDHFVGYDKRLLEAARERGLPVATPTSSSD